MAGIGTADVTYTVKNLRRLGNSKVGNRIQLAFGDSSKTYSAGGIPLVIGNLGCPNVVESLVVVEQGTAGYLFSFIQSTNKLAIFQSAAASHGHILFLKEGDVADSATSRVNTGANKLGANTGSNITVGTIASTAASGGIINATIAAGSLVEVTSVAIAAQTIVVEVIGW